MLWIRGAVYVVDFRRSDGSVIEKLALCLQQGKVVNNSDTFLGVLLTTQHIDRSYPWEVKVSAEESRSDAGVRVLCGQIHTIPKAWVKKYVYALRPETMREVDKALLRALCIVSVP